MKTIFKNSVIICGLVTMLASCEIDNPTEFSGDPAINFATDSLAYSFLGNNTGEYIAEIPVHIIGNTVDYDRTFSVEVLQDEITTASPGQYEILETIVPANSFMGKLKVKVFNTDEIGEQGSTIHLAMTESQDFTVGNIENNDYVLRWTNKVVVPNWQWFRFFFTRYSSTRAYLIFVEVTGMTDFTRQDYMAVGPTGAAALGKAYGDYIRKYNSEHPNAPLTHDDGDHAGEEIIPVN